MAVEVGRAGEYGHNNSAKAFVDSDFVRGGIRKVANDAGLTGLSSNSDQLKENVTIVYHEGDSAFYLLTDENNISNKATGWTDISTIVGSTGSGDTPAIKSVSGTPSFTSGITAEEIRDLIDLGTSDSPTFTSVTSDVTGDLTGNADTVTTTADATNSFRSVVFTATTGVDADMLVDGNFRYNPYTNTLSINGIANPDDDVVINLGGSSTDATFTGNVTGDVTGNADTSTKFAASVNIGGVAFDGSASIDLPGVNTAGTQNTIGQAGTVAALTGLDTDDLAEGSTNLFFTSAEQTKLANIEANATADQTDAEIKTAYENNANTNAFTDAQQSKLTGIANNATANDTDANLKNTDNHTSGSTNKVFTATEQTKLLGIAQGAEVNAVDSVNTQTGAVVLDADDINDASTANKFTTAGDITKLANIATGATANDTDANLKNRSNHTGTQPASTISDFDTEVTNNTTVADHTSKLAVIKPKVDHISVTQAVDLDDMESDINSNTTNLTNIQNVLKSAFTGGGAGIYSDSNKGTSDSFMGITSTTAIFQAGGNTKLSMSETSPGSIDLFVQAGSTGNEAAYKAVAIDGSNTSATAEISLNGSVVVTGTVRNPTTISFNKQATAPTAIAGGLYADTSDNLYFGVS